MAHHMKIVNPIKINGLFVIGFNQLSMRSVGKKPPAMRVEARRF